MKYCPDCGAARIDGRCPQCGRSFNHTWQVVLTVACICGVLVFLAIRFTVNEASKVTNQQQYSSIREEIEAYDAAAEVVHHKMSRIIDVPVAPFSAEYVNALGGERYRVEVPYQGYGTNGQPATQTTTCLVHCQRGLCYVDTIGD